MSSKSKNSEVIENVNGKELEIKKNSELTIDPVEDSSLNDPILVSDPATQKKVNALKNLQLDMLKVEAEFFDELHELECKYSKLYEPFYEKRKQIVLGEYEPRETECKWALDEDDESEKSEASKAQKAIEPATGVEEAKKEKGIANFWLETLQSFRITAELVQDIDEPVLAYLQDIRVKYLDKQPYGYMLEFHFGDNPYFTNKVLTKTYHLTTEIDAKDPFSFEGPDLSKSEGCKIDWKEGKNITVKLVKKKLKSKNKKAPPKIITKEEEQETFFNFFKSPDQHSNKLALKKDSDIDEEDSDELLRIADFEIGQYFREKIVPKAVLYYSGEFDGFDDFDDDDDDDDDDNDDDEDDENEKESDEDDEDEDESKNVKGLSDKKGLHVKAGMSKSSSGTEPTPSECKQT